MISLLLACGLMPFSKKVITKFSSTFCLEVFGQGIWKLALYITHSYLVSVYFLVNLTLNIYNLFATNSFINNSDANKKWRKSVSESKKRKVSDKINLTVFFSRGSTHIVWFRPNWKLFRNWFVFPPLYHDFYWSPIFHFSVN